MAGEPFAFGGPGRLEPGARVAGYVIEEQVGAGGMAVVFRARDEVLGRLAAIKVLAPALAADDEFRARFLRESRAAASVDEPHIIPVYAAGETEGMLYIATRFVAGGDLGALLRRNQGPVEPARAAALIAQVASALDAAHRAGLVHRDVKPANVLVDLVPGQAEHAYLSDFGLIKSTSTATGLTASGRFMGTPDYCAPEQIEGREVDGRTDQYALAGVAFVLLTGVPPFPRPEMVATLYAHLNDPVPAVTRFRPGLPPALNPALARAMAKNPQDRFASCGEFAAALRAALVPAPFHSAPGGPPGPPGYQPTFDSVPAPRVPDGTANTQTAPPATFAPGPASPGRPVSPDRPASPGRPASRRRNVVLVASAAVVLAVAGTVTALLLPDSGPGTGRPHPSGSASVSSSPRSPAVSVSGTINAAGSTSQTNFQESGIQAFKTSDPDVTVNYDGVGSGAGLLDLASRTVLFAGSDSPVPASEQTHFKGKTVLYFPVQIGPIAIAFNLPHVSRLNLDATTLAGIFQGTIKTWNDPVIKALNPGVSLPAIAVTPVTRSDSSATTQNFSLFLEDAAGSGWRLGSSSTIRWPDDAVETVGDTGVAQAVKSIPGEIGYVDSSEATVSHLTVASIKNKAGHFVAPSAAAATAAVASVTPAANLTFRSVWTGGTTAYPITYPSWDLAYARQPNANDAALLKSYLGFLLSSQGQALLAPLGLAPLPANIDRAAVARLSKITS